MEVCIKQPVLQQPRFVFWSSIWGMVMQLRFVIIYWADSNTTLFCDYLSDKQYHHSFVWYSATCTAVYCLFNSGHLTCGFFFQTCCSHGGARSHSIPVCDWGGSSLVPGRHNIKYAHLMSMLTTGKWMLICLLMATDAQESKKQGTGKH